VYLRALDRLPQQTKERGVRMLESGCGGGMNLIHLIPILSGKGINLDSAVGTDFLPSSHPSRCAGGEELPASGRLSQSAVLCCQERDSNRQPVVGARQRKD
jgi:hypothetical protein